MTRAVRTLAVALTLIASAVGSSAPAAAVVPSGYWSQSSTGAFCGSHLDAYWYYWHNVYNQRSTSPPSPKTLRVYDYRAGQGVAEYSPQGYTSGKSPNQKHRFVAVPKSSGSHRMVWAAVWIDGSATGTMYGATVYRPC